MLLNYKNVSIYHDDGEKVLKGINLTINEGDYIYIIGKVGTGKSSLLKSIYAEKQIEEADEAIALGFDLQKIKNKQIPKLRRQMGIIFQEFRLLTDRTVYQNLLFVLKATGWKKSNEIEKRIDEVLKAVGLPESKDKMPHELSGGEQQRIAIARAILNKPKLIVADEPTGPLDTEMAETIITLLHSIAQQGTAVIMTTHNIQLMKRYPGKIYCCNNGRIEHVGIGENHDDAAEFEESEEDYVTD